MKKKALFLLILFMLSWFWVLTFYLRYGLMPPKDISRLILQDLEFLGPYVLILDVIVVVVLFSFIIPYLRKRSDATEDSCEDEPLDNRNNN